MFDSLAEGVTIADLEGNILQTNDAAARLHGYGNKEEMIGRDAFELIAGRDRARAMQNLKRTLEKGLSGVIEYAFLRKDGSEFAAELNASTIKNTLGKPIGFVAVSRDITERKRIEEALRVERDKAQRYLAVAGVMIVVLGVDERVTLINERGCQILGYTPEEIIGQDWCDLCVSERYRGEVKAIFRKLRAGQVQPVEYFENPVLTKSGDERIIAWHNSVMTNGAGNIVGFLGSGEDITKLKKAEHSLRRLNDEYLATINQTGDIIVRMDKNDRRILVNDGACRFFGLSREELLGGEYGNHTHPGDQRASFRAINKMKETGNPVINLVSRQIVPLGERVVEWNCHPLFDKNKQYYGWQATGRDITEREKLEEEIIQARAKMEALAISEKMKTRLLSFVSHELRTPLAAIKGFASTLLQPDINWSEKEQKDFIEEIDKKAEQLEYIVDDLMEMSHFEAGMLRLNLNTYKLHEVVELAVTGLTKIAANHRLEVKIPRNLPSICIDETRIVQVLTNLVDNAAKFSAEGSQILIGAQPSKKEIIVNVTDQGIGIPTEHLGKVFDRFYQAEAIVSGAKRGTGLGLSICQTIIAAHGGQIWVESKVGEGSRFSFSLPVNQDIKKQMPSYQIVR